jgi:predicted nucleotidyltransferase component of viral defense system
MSLKQRLLKKQQEKKANWNIIELDHALSWVLAAIGEDPDSKENLIFKGGTCLKKCYFGEHYRFSEDLDFSADPQLTDSFLDSCLERILDKATTLSNQMDAGIIYTAEPYLEKQAHPFNQRAYIVRAQYPWHRTPLTKIKLEISRDEHLVYPTVEKPILHEYGEILPQRIKTYALEEILTEKYRGILQNQQRLKIKGWVRSRIRDFYDLWRILTQFKNEVNLMNFRSAFITKCQHKDIQFEGPQQFFMDHNYLQQIKGDWDQFLEGLLEELPSFEATITELETLTWQVFRELVCC